MDFHCTITVLASGDEAYILTLPNWFLPIHALSNLALNIKNKAFRDFRLIQISFLVAEMFKGWR